MKKTRWLLSFTEADLGKLPISQIEAPDVLTTLRRVENKGNHESARRLRSTIGSVFKYAIATGRATKDPTDHTHRPTTDGFACATTRRTQAFRVGRV